MSDIAEEILEGFEELLQKLKEGEVQVTEVTIEHTPDGPLTTFEEKTL